jgi:hypothetical protein
VIGYRIALSNLTNRIRQESPTWLTRSRARAAEFVAAQSFNEQSSIWSEVKPVYMRLQGGSKCAYCERKLESENFGLVEQDVEHFRPKKAVLSWAIPAELANLGIATSVVPQNSGYFRLAYHPFNYCAACKPCNSAIKANYFPIEGTYNFNSSSAAALRREKALLIYPIGNSDSDPEVLIEFYGASPRPVVKSGFRYRKALTSIAFFGLDEATRRKNLYQERAKIMGALFPQLDIRAGIIPADDAMRGTANRLINGYTRAESSHANCARSYVRLYGSDRAAAERLYHEAGKLEDASS